MRTERDFWLALSFDIIFFTEKYSVPYNYLNAYRNKYLFMIKILWH